MGHLVRGINFSDFYQNDCHDHIQMSKMHGVLQNKLSFEEGNHFSVINWRELGPKKEWRSG